MNSSRPEIEAAIAALESQRALLGDAVVDTALALLRERLGALERESSRNDALRTLSVLFLDVVGSTAISRELDPEDVRAVFHSALRRFSNVVEQYEGSVLRYAGDGMMALFGAKGVREDDAERAVRCGLALIAEARLMAPKFQSEHRVAGFSVRVGISTGPVLLSAGVDDGYDVSGITVSVAARMEQTAPPGALRITHDTYANVRGLVEVVEQPPTAVKGLEQPIVTYLVKDAKPRNLTSLTQALESWGLPLVGREGELTWLMDAFKEVASSGVTKVVMLSGEAGIGKSRLMLAFRNWLRERAGSNAAFYARAHPYGGGVPYGLVRDLFFSRFGIADSDSLSEAAKKLHDALAPLFGDRGEERIALVGQLIGLDFSSSPHIAGILGDPRQLRDRAFHTVTEFLRTAVEGHRAVVLLFDDVHWADEGSLDFIRHLSDSPHGAAVLCVCATRPDVFVPGAASGVHLSAYERVDVARFSSNVSRGYADGLLRNIDQPPESLRDLIVDVAEGNPFYMEEIVRMLIDDQVIIAGEGRWHVATQRLVSLRVPPTLAGVLQARVDALAGSERACLQAASVVGAVFWDEAIGQIDAVNMQTLPRLVERKLVARHEHTAFDGAREFAFHHHLLHRVTYDTVLKQARRKLHQRIAQWLVSRTTDRAGEFSGLIAQHFENAGDSENAVVHLTKAAEHAADRFQRKMAIDHLTRALVLTAEHDLSGRFEIVSRRARILHGMDRPAEQEADVATLERIADQANEDPYRARAAAARATFAIVTGDFEGAARAAERVVRLASLVPAWMVCFARINWARAVQYQGDYAQARMHIEEGLRLARQANEDQAARVAVVQLGLMDGELGRFSSARRHFDEALRAARDAGDKRMEGIVISNLAAVEQAVGNYPRARALLEAGRRLSVEVGDALTDAYALANLAAVLNAQGDARAVELASQAVDRARRVKALDLEANALIILGDAQLDFARLDDAVACYGTSLAQFQQLGREMMVPLATSKLAKAALRRDEMDVAMQHAAEVIAHVDAGRPVDRSTAPTIYFECFNVMAAARHPRALEFLTLAHDEVLRQAQDLEPAERESYLQDVATNASIMRAVALGTGRADQLRGDAAP